MRVKILQRISHTATHYHAGVEGVIIKHS